MKLRELIEKLQELERMHDSLEVVVTEPEWHGDIGPLKHKVFDARVRCLAVPKKTGVGELTGEFHVVSIVAEGFEPEDDD